MDRLIDLIRTRRSVRRYRAEPVSREAIEACIEAARLAPSAENVQPWRFVVVDDAALVQRLMTACSRGIYLPTRFARKAPAIIVVLARLDVIANRLAARVQGTQFYLLDLGAACEHLILQATELGLGTCWIGWFSKRAVRRVLGVPRRYKIVALIAVGYPADAGGRQRSKKPLSEIASYNRVGPWEGVGGCSDAERR